LTVPLREAPGANHQTPLKIATGDQFFDEQPRHDGFAGAGIVGQQKPQWLTGQHCFIHCRNLVWQRLNDRRVHRQHRIEEMREPDAMRFGNETEELPVAVEAPRPPLGRDFGPLLIVPVQEFVGDLAARILVGELKRF
jgi:hypothetical protein